MLSVNRFFIDNGVSFCFDAQRVQVQDVATDEVLVEGRANGGLYELPMKIQSSDGSVNLCEKLPHFSWHCCLGYLTSVYMSILVKNGVIKASPKSLILCKPCQLGKSHALPHPSHKTSYKPLDLVFADIWGPAPVASFERYRYYVNFVKAGSNYNWVYPIFRKNYVYQIFEKFRCWVERQCATRILALQTYNTKEFIKLGK